MALLSVRGLDITFRSRDGDTHAVRNVSFDVAKGETVAIVGEFGVGEVRHRAVHRRAGGGYGRGLWVRDL